MSKATLLVIQGVDQGTRFEIGETPCGIGRGVHNHIRILDTEASRAHARVEWQGDHFVVSDLASSNGTFVNGQTIRSRPLANGDQIQIGRSVLLFSEAARAEDSRYVAERVTLTDPHDAAAQIVGQTVPDAPLKTTISAGQAYQQTLANLQVLYRISEEAVRPSLSIDQLLQQILDITLANVGAERGCMLLRDVHSEQMVPQVFSPRLQGAAPPMPVSRSIVDYVLKTRQGVRTSDARSDARFTPGQSILQAGIREAMCVPLQGRYELMGVVYVDIMTPPERVLLEGGPTHKFTDDMLRLLAAIGRQAALAVEDNRYQQALVKAERLAAVGQTIATLSHHIKNILQGVRGGSYLIDMGLRDHNEEVVRKGWKIVERNQNRIYSLVMDMLTFSKERQPAYQVAALNETVADACELVQARAAEGEVAFEVTLDPHVPQALFDPEGIHRAVLNVVTNALDAVEGVAGARVQVATGFDAPSKSVYVLVTDNGSGIPADQMGRLFNLFESTKGSRGTGLGLAVSQKILREHGGEIRVQSEPGRGSQFMLMWPLIEEDRHALESKTQG